MVSLTDFSSSATRILFVMEVVSPHVVNLISTPHYLFNDIK